MTQTPVTTDGVAAPDAQQLEPVPLAPTLATPRQRLDEGKAMRRQVSRSCHALWQPPPDREDPSALVHESSRTRLPDLVAVRYGRMLQSPFHFLRGAPIVMAHDLARTPATGLTVQACGDAHLCNFGVYASPERRLLFDVNDFDETLPGPWEWDIKRLTASCHVAARVIGLPDAEGADAVRACVRSYRERMRQFSRMRLLDVWYSRVDARSAIDVLGRTARRATRPASVMRSLAKLTEEQGGRLRIRDDPPRVTHVDDPHLGENLRRLFRSYLPTLSDDRRHLLERYRFLDFARKVVGVGSVGTRCYIVLLDSSHPEDPLFLQIKEAGRSVLEPFAGQSRFKHQGQRVVSGQRLMQSASDIFLGWARMDGHDFYVRQLRDMKATATLDGFTAAGLRRYVELCGWALARAHARGGDAARIAGYLGRSDVFDEALVRFARAYADQTERDFEDFEDAVAAGKLPAERGV
jgi:uncharacterized protein (DUF2252 family)